MTYSGRATEVQDEGNGSSRITKIYQSDGLGRLTSVCEVTSAAQLGGSSGTPSACGQDIAETGFLTSYGYDGLGNLTSVTQNGLNARSYTYDMLSRLTSETNPESGATTYTYDSCSAGDLCTRVRPKANQTSPSVTTTTTYAYDALHRLLSKSYDDGTTPSMLYWYDVHPTWGADWVTNTKGRLVEAKNGYAGEPGQGTSTVSSYDAMGRIIQQWQQTPNIAPSGYGVQSTYDLLGDLASTSNFAENVTYTYSYNGAAQLSQFQSNYSDATHPPTLLTVNQYTR